METIKAARFDTRWKPGVTTEVEQNTDTAIESIRGDNPDVKVFTDGSGMESKTGASAVLYRNNRIKSTLRFQLGSAQHHTVYEGEGVGALLGTRLINKEWGVQSAHIYIDNQATIAATTLTKPNAGHYIYDALHDAIATLRKNHIE